MSSTTFVNMLQAYRDTLGKAYARQDIADVVAVFRECAKDQTTTQDRIRKTTDLSATNLSKIVKSAMEQGWVRAATTRGADGTKEVSLTAKGRRVFDEFESRCVAACSEAKKAARSRAGRGGKTKSVRTTGREGILEMYNADGTPRIP